MTWGEFKKWVEDKGVRDDYKILYFDFTDEPDLGIEIGVDSSGKHFFNIC